MAPGLSNLTWRKSSRSGGNGGACVEVAHVAPAVALRDSKNPAGPALILPAGAWDTFRESVKGGTFDLA